jgi:cytochrome c nitrite reductase small subunit
MPRTLPGLLSGLVGVMLGVGAYTFHFAEGLSYFSNDPEACANCHIMNDHLESWEKSSHHVRAVCNDCHMPHALLPKLITKADNGWNHSVKFTLQNFADPLRIRSHNLEVVRENCIRCHAAVVEDIRDLPGHEEAGELACIHCHAGVGHGPRR